MLVTVVFVVMGWSQVKRMEPRRAFEFNHLFFRLKASSFRGQNYVTMYLAQLEGLLEKDLDR